MILIVDDDHAIRSSLGLLMKQKDYLYEAVSTSAQALELVRRGNIDLVILDMNLSLTTTGRDGIELLRKIKILAPAIPVILISAWGTIPLAVEGMQYGAVDFISKPWSNKDILDKIKRALKDKYAEDETPPTLDSIERTSIQQALRRCDGNVAKAAEELGISRQALYRRMEKYGI